MTREERLKRKLARLNRRIEDLDLELRYRDYSIWSDDFPARRMDGELGDLEYQRAKVRLGLERLSSRTNPERAKPESEVLSAEGAEATSEFTHSKDYSSATLRGETYTLTSRQSQMIGILHEAQTQEKPDVTIARILEELGTTNSRWQDTWKTNRAARTALIKVGTRKGTLRLNV
jgi:hypothetical protein